jgi:PadR family transcriptional regulator, regulatory protein AphA
MKPRTPQGRFVLLGMLDIEEMSGYDLKQSIEQSVAHFWREGYGQIYPALQEMEAQGLIASRVEEHPGRPNKKVYRVLDAGRARLREWLDEPALDQVPRNELLLKLFFGRMAPAASMRAHLIERREKLREDQKNFDMLKAALAEDDTHLADRPYWLMTLSYGEHVTKAELAWCEEVLTQLEEVR